MQIAQRCVLVIGMCIMLSFFSAFLYNDRENILTKDWEKVHTERFLRQLCRNGQCSQEDYVIFFETLSRSGNKVEIRIEEYRLEQDLTKRRYYSVVSWEEIYKILCEGKRYAFSENSIILVEISQLGRIMTTKNRRFGWVIGEYGNDT